ncbi:aminotransferase class I/II-fold pyridoxal phosphate-dependent enzyme [Hutsoniella sourekii]
MDQLLAQINHNVTKITESPIRLFDQEISSIPGLIKLTLGEPDFNTPDHIKQAGIQTIQADDSHYAPTPGKLELRQVASEFVKEKYGLDYQGDSEVIVTVGATEALFASLQTVINPGDKVLIPAPFFGLYQSMVTLIGGQAVQIDTSANNFVLSPQMVEEALDEHGDQVKAIILNYPTNPTGINWSQAEAEALASVLKDKPIFVISDEVYSEIVYEGDHHSIAKYLPKQTLVINGVSKSHAMTGWRIGLIFARQALIQEIAKVHQQLVTTTNNVSQMAALEALKNGKEDHLEMVQAYQERRDYLFDHLTRLGFKIVKPTGAFYIFAGIPEDMNQDSMAFARELANQARVGIIPGIGFGAGGEGHVRFSYASSLEEIKEAVRRIEDYLTQVRS